MPSRTLKSVVTLVLLITNSFFNTDFFIFLIYIPTGGKKPSGPMGWKPPNAQSSMAFTSSPFFSEGGNDFPQRSAANYRRTHQYNAILKYEQNNNWFSIWFSKEWLNKCVSTVPLGFGRLHSCR